MKYKCPMFKASEQVLKKFYVEMVDKQYPIDKHDIKELKESRIYKGVIN